MQVHPPVLILASASPRRQQLLADAGIALRVVPCPLPEPTERPAHVSPARWAESLAYFKASAVARSRTGLWVLGADTVVVCGDELLGKPRDLADARRMLELQAGRRSDVITGLALLRATPGGYDRHLAHDITGVWMRDDHAEREAYLASGDWAGKAGAYGIQDIGDRLVERIVGSFTNVVGLPVERVRRLLAQVGFRPTAAWTDDAAARPAAPG